MIQAILAYRVEELTRRRAILGARSSATDLRSVLEAHQLPLMELAEDEDCYYLPFLEQLIRVVHPLDDLPEGSRDCERVYYERVGALLGHIPQALREIRIRKPPACAYMRAPTATVNVCSARPSRHMPCMLVNSSTRS